MQHLNFHIKSVKKLLEVFIFSIYTRMLLCLGLIFTESLSGLFNTLIVIIFCLPIARYITCSITKTEMHERNNTVIFCFSSFLYIGVFARILAIYNVSTLLTVFIISIPVILYAVFLTGKLKTNKQYLLTSLCFYILPFLLAINCAFDFYKPKTEKYTILRRHDQHIVGTDTDHYMYYLDLVPVSLAFERIDQKKPKNYERKKVDREVYNKFIDKEHLDIQIHPGLLGIEWITYR